MISEAAWSLLRKSYCRALVGVGWEKRQRSHHNRKVFIRLKPDKLVTSGIPLNSLNPFYASRFKFFLLLCGISSFGLWSAISAKNVEIKGISI